MRVGRGLVAAICVALVIAGCAPESGARPSPSAAGCRTGPSTIVSAPGVKHVAVAWPLGLRGFAPEEVRAIIDWTPGTLNLVLLVQVASAPPFTMQGHRCSDGHPLRFSYRGLPPVSTSADGTRTPIPSVVFETEGEEVVPFDAYENSTPGSHFFPGFMLFSSAGDWVIETRIAGVLQGSAVLQLRTRP